ncbi:hypothetical protein O4H51_22260 [Aeromonas hydrophila]|uniref:hypothetical protein n=1 Tax=Aeromonas hydrophila TaxID=644 RepID=UPI0022B05926|nr:hypothetical protein [Aeromonas hydrophila]MCZ4335570.1 hypothetical protein [Aeromonas hydrophila]
MKRKFLLLSLTPLLVTCQLQAQSLKQLVSWQAVVSKASQSSVSLLHPGQQHVSTSNQAQGVLAAKLTEPGSGLMLQARALSSDTNAPNVTLNGRNLTNKYQAIPITENYYLNYYKSDYPGDIITESGYELIAYWQP